MVDRTLNCVSDNEPSRSMAPFCDSSTIWNKISKHNIKAPKTYKWLLFFYRTINFSPGELGKFHPES